MRHGFRPTLAALVAALALTATSAERAPAQERPRGSTPTDGDWSLMFTAFEPDALTHFGLFRMFGDRANVGLEAELNWADGEQKVEQGDLSVRAEGTSWTFLVGPSLRWYGNRTGPISPYLRTRLGVGWGGSGLHVNDEKQSETESATVQVSLGVGAEWYPLRQLGVGGHTGLVFTRTETDDRNLQNGRRSDGMTQNLRTFRSGIVVNFYFR